MRTALRPCGAEVPTWGEFVGHWRRGRRDTKPRIRSGGPFGVAGCALGRVGAATSGCGLLLWGLSAADGAHGGRVCPAAAERAGRLARRLLGLAWGFAVSGGFTASWQPALLFSGTFVEPEDSSSRAFVGVFRTVEAGVLRCAWIEYVVSYT